MAALSTVARHPGLLSAEIVRAMNLIARDDRTIFVGQSVRYDGATIYTTLEGVPEHKRLEMPVIEDFQLGFCIGLSLTGKIPICIYPRMDFVLLAMNQLVNHLDRIELMSGFKPRVIIRTRIGATAPLDAGVQHTGNYCWAFRKMLRVVRVFELSRPEDAGIYQEAVESGHSWVIAERG